MQQLLRLSIITIHFTFFIHLNMYITLHTYIYIYIYLILCALKFMTLKYVCTQSINTHVSTNYVCMYVCMYNILPLSLLYNINVLQKQMKERHPCALGLHIKSFNVLHTQSPILQHNHSNDAPSCTTPIHYYFTHLILHACTYSSKNKKTKKQKAKE